METIGNIRPSPPLSVSAHASVSDCVRLMRDKGVGSLLVTSHSDDKQLLGIFTERDLLKWIDDIQHGGHWDKPIAHIMSRPVKTLPISRFHEAAEMMLKHGFRHVPITQPAARGGSQLVGVISIRDVLAKEVEDRRLRGQLPTRKTRKRRILFVGASETTSRLESNNLQSWAGAATPEGYRIYWKLNQPLHSYSVDPTIEESAAADLVVLDIDGMAPDLWSRFLRQVNRLEDAPSVIVLMTPGLNTEMERRTLSALSKAGKWTAFEKPVSLPGFTMAFRAAIRG